MNLSIEIAIEALFVLALMIAKGMQRIGIPSKTRARMHESESEREELLRSVGGEEQHYLNDRPTCRIIDSRAVFVFAIALAVIVFLSPQNSATGPMERAVFYIALWIQFVCVVAYVVVGIGKFRHVSPTRRNGNGTT